MKNLLNFLLRVGISAALLWWLFSKIDTEKTFEVLKTADLKFLFAGLFIFFIVNIILLLRWRLFIKALDLTAPIFDVLRFYCFGLFGNLFLPSAIGGDIIKIVGLCKNSSEKPKVVASVILDRLSGFAAIVLVAVSSFIFAHKLINDNTLLIPIVLMAIGSITIISILFNEKIYEGCCRIFNKFPKIKDPLMKLHYDIVLLKHSHNRFEGVKGIGLSAFSQIIYACCFYFIAKSLHQDVPLVYFLIFVPIICVAASFPSIGGLGVREAGTAYLFTKVGVDSGIAVSMSLINFLFMILIGLLGGLIYVITLSSRRVQHSSSDS